MAAYDRRFTGLKAVRGASRALNATERELIAAALAAGLARQIRRGASAEEITVHDTEARQAILRERARRAQLLPSGEERREAVALK